MKKITLLIDKVASTLESEGFLKEALELDVISNTIEKEAFNYDPDEAKTTRSSMLPDGAKRVNKNSFNILPESIKKALQLMSSFDWPTNKMKVFQGYEYEQDWDTDAFKEEIDPKGWPTVAVVFPGYEIKPTKSDFQKIKSALRSPNEGEGYEVEYVTFPDTGGYEKDEQGFLFTNDGPKKK